MTKDLINKAYSLFNKGPVEVNNMYTNKAEQHYFELYFPAIHSRIKPDSYILDIGCQNGRFTIPLANEGHHLTATDIESIYFDFIKANLNEGIQVEFLKEKVSKTISNQKINHFDAILCLELLYTMKDVPKLLNGFSNILKPNGLLVTSHRSLGYYIYRYLKEGELKALDQILNNNHPAFNCQTPDQLKDIYTSAGYEVEEIRPIGMFSGFSKDPFSFVTNPELMKESDLRSVTELENNPIYQSLFANNARYLQVVARVKQ